MSLHKTVSPGTPERAKEDKVVALSRLSDHRIKEQGSGEVRPGREDGPHRAC